MDEGERNARDDCKHGVTHSPATAAVAERREQAVEEQVVEGRLACQLIHTALLTMVVRWRVWRWVEFEPESDPLVRWLC